MVDCGEGTQIQLRRSRIGFTRIGHVFISHLHGDHCFGLLGMISTFGMLGRTAPLHIYAPQELEHLLQMELELYCKGLEYEVVFHAVDTTKSAIVYEDRSLTVTSIPLEHRIPCCGYLFREKPTLPHIRRDMIDCFEIPLWQVNNIKNGADGVTPTGEVIAHERLVTAPDPVRSYAYCSDTRYMPRLADAVKGVNVLYHESTYSASNEERAQMYFHSTSRQAAQTALDAGVGQLVLGHFSARYENDEVMRAEAAEVFPNVVLANENTTIDVK